MSTSSQSIPSCVQPFTTILWWHAFIQWCHWSKWVFVHLLATTCSEYVAIRWLGWTSFLPVIAHPCSNCVVNTLAIMILPTHINVHFACLFYSFETSKTYRASFKFDIEKKEATGKILVTLFSILSHKLIHITLCKLLH